MHIDRLGEELKNIGSAMESTKASNFWEDKCSSLIALAERDNPRNFLQWEPIKATMHGGNSQSCIQHYYNLLEMPNFRSRWELGIKEAPNGNPVPFALDRNSSPLLIQQNNHLAVYELVMKGLLTDVDLVVEVGGGYGSMCRLFYQLGYSGKYFIYDIPPFSVLQELYLKDLNRDVTRNMDAQWKEVWITYDYKNILRAIDIYSGQKILFMATWSLSEMPLEEREKVTVKLDAYTHFLIAYQAEMSGVNNIQYIEAFASLLPNDVLWKRINIDATNHYFFAKKDAK